jgi:hypothetical protein
MESFVLVLGMEVELGVEMRDSALRFRVFRKTGVGRVEWTLGLGLVQAPAPVVTVPVPAPGVEMDVDADADVVVQAFAVNIVRLEEPGPLILIGPEHAPKPGFKPGLGLDNFERNS